MEKRFNKDVVLNSYFDSLNMVELYKVQEAMDKSFFQDSYLQLENVQDLTDLQLSAVFAWWMNDVCEDSSNVAEHNYKLLKQQMISRKLYEL